MIPEQIVKASLLTDVIWFSCKDKLRKGSKPNYDKMLK